MGINKNEFWDSNFYNHPRLTDEILKIAEEQLGVELPKLFIELLRIQNGGYTKGFVFPMTQRTTWADNHVPLSQLFGIVVDKNIKTAQNIMDSQYMINEWGLPEKQVLLNGDGHWWITLDYRTEGNPTVNWIDVEFKKEIKLTDNFDDFINRLVSEDSFIN